MRSAMREEVRCTRCDLNQFAGRKHCRRCEKELPGWKEPEEGTTESTDSITAKGTAKATPEVVERVVVKKIIKLVPMASARTAIVSWPLAPDDLLPTFEAMERALYAEAWRRTRGNGRAVIRMLQVGQTMGYRRLREYGLMPVLDRSITDGKAVPSDEAMEGVLQQIQ